MLSNVQTFGLFLETVRCARTELVRRIHKCYPVGTRVKNTCVCVCVGLFCITLLCLGRRRQVAMLDCCAVDAVTVWVGSQHTKTTAHYRPTIHDIVVFTHKRLLQRYAQTGVPVQPRAPYAHLIGPTDRPPAYRIPKCMTHPFEVV